MFLKNSFKNTIRVANILDPDQTCCLAGLILVQTVCKVYQQMVQIGKQLTQVPGREVQSVTCLATDVSLTADPGVASSIPARPILSWRLIMK